MPIKNCKIRKGVTIHHPDLVNLYGCKIGENSSIGAFTEIGEGVIIGRNTRIGAFCFIPSGVRIGHNCFIAPRVTFMNDSYPPAPKETFVPEKTEICDGVVIGAGSKILPGVRIEENCKVGAGSVVTKDVTIPNCWYRGNPARPYIKVDVTYGD